MFRVGEFARLSRASVKMLRHYDRIGLLRPAWTDPATGYRHYTASQLPRLNRILLLRELGFGLADIAALVDRPAGDGSATAAYDRQEADIDRQLAVLARRRRALRALRSAGEGRDVAVVVRPVPAVEVVARRVELGAGDDVAEVFDEVESAVRDAGVRADAPPLAVVHGRSGGTVDVEVAVPVSGPAPVDPPLRAVRLPAVPAMACTVHAGGYGTLAEALAAMRSWLDGAGYRAVSPVVRHVYLRFGAEPALALPPAWVTDGGDYVTELQLAVEATG